MTLMELIQFDSINGEISSPMVTMYCMWSLKYFNWPSNKNYQLKQESDVFFKQIAMQLEKDNLYNMLEYH